MPRPRKLDRPVERKVSIPFSLSARLDILLADPFTGRVRYGAFSDLMVELLAQHLDKTTKENKNES